METNIWDQDWSRHFFDLSFAGYVNTSWYFNISLVDMSIFLLHDLMVLPLILKWQVLTGKPVRLEVPFC